MQQQTLDLLTDLNQPLKSPGEFYGSTSLIQEAYTLNSFLVLIKSNREFFGDSVVNLPGGTFLRKSFQERFNDLLDLKNPSNLPKAA